MGQLGYALTGGLQGYGQGLQNRNEQKYKQQQQQMDQSRLQMDKDQFAQGEHWKKMAFAQQQLDKANAILLDPERDSKWHPDQIAAAKAQRDAVYAQMPDLNPASSQVQPPAPTGPPATPAPQPPAPPQTDAQGSPLMTPADLFDLQQQNKPASLPWEQDPLQAMGVNTMPDFNPNGIIPDHPERPLANPGTGITGTQNPVTAGSFPPNPFPQPVSVPHPAPVQPSQGPVAGPQQPLDVDALIRNSIADLAKGLNDPNKTPAEKEHDLQALLAAAEAYRNGDVKAAQAGLFRAQTHELPIDSSVDRLAKMAEARYHDLAGQAAYITATAKQEGTDPKVMIELQRLALEVKKAQDEHNDRLAAQNLEALKTALSNAHQTNQDTLGLAGLQQHGQEYLGTQSKQDQARIEAPFLHIMQTVLAPVDRITGLPRPVKDFENKYSAAVHTFRQKNGYEPDPARMVPAGIDPSIWAGVVSPGFNFDTSPTVQSLRHSRDPHAARALAQVKVALALKQKMGIQ